MTSVQAFVDPAGCTSDLIADEIDSREIGNKIVCRTSTHLALFTLLLQILENVRVRAGKLND